MRGNKKFKFQFRKINEEELPHGEIAPHSQTQAQKSFYVQLEKMEVL